MKQDRHVTDLLPDLLAGTISGPDARNITSHLSVCPDCKREFDDMSRLWAMLGQVPQELPARPLRPRFDAMLAAYEEGLKSWVTKPSSTETFAARVLRWRPSNPVLQVGFALAVFVCGVLVGGRWPAPARAIPDEGMSMEVATLRGEVQAMNRMLAVSLMQQSSASERLRGVSMSHRVADSDSQMIDALLATLNYDTDVNVRLASIDALGKFCDEPEVRSGLLRSLTKQKSPLVQIALIDMLVAAQERNAPAEFAQLARRPGTDKTVRTRLEQAIQQIL